MGKWQGEEEMEVHKEPCLVVRMEAAEDSVKDVKKVVLPKRLSRIANLEEHLGKVYRG